MEPLLLPARAPSIVRKVTSRVANTFAYHGQVKHKAFKQTIGEQRLALEIEGKNFIKAQKDFENRKTKIKQLRKQKKILSAPKAFLARSYQTTLRRLLETHLVDDFATDRQRRVIITTKPLSIKRDVWAEPKIAGRYQIRIAPSKEKFRDGIQILNISQAFQRYQSPTISGVIPCWGNIEQDIASDFRKNDIYELITDLLDYLQSPDVVNGFIHLPNQGKETGWEQFFDNAEKRPDGFCFRVYDRQGESGGRLTVATSENGPVMNVPNLGNTMNISNQAFYAVDTALLATTDMLETIITRRPRLNQAEAAVFQLLRDFGFGAEAAYRFVPLIVREDLPPCEELLIVMRGDNFAILHIVRSPGYHEDERYGVNRPDMTPEAWHHLLVAREISWQSEAFLERQRIEERRRHELERPYRSFAEEHLGLAPHSQYGAIADNEQETRRRAIENDPSIRRFIPQETFEETVSDMERDIERVSAVRRTY